jgi:hypothetical protein
MPDKFVQTDRRAGFPKLGYKPAKIGILTSLTGISFQECYEKCIKTKSEDLTINFLDLESLKKNKLERFI